MDIARLCLLAQFVSTLYMTGVIWYVQVVHYPLFSRVGSAVFAEYEASHCSLTTMVVAPAMLIEAFSAVLFIRFHPAGIKDSEAAAGAALVMLIWIATALFSIPYHKQLAAGFAIAAHNNLCRLNWIRTVAWTGRSALLGYWLLRLLPS